MNKDLLAIFEYMEREKGIKRAIVISAIEESLLTAARKSLQDLANVAVQINPKTGDIEVTTEKEIVNTADLDDPSLQITLDAARELDPDCQIGQFIDIPVETTGLGRIAANTARQIITQKLRSAERDVIYEEYRHRLKELVSGTVKRLVRGSNVIVDLGKVEGIMPMRNYPKTEHYHVGDRVQALLLEVRDLENGGAEVVLSRSHPEFVEALFAQEVPEVNDGTVVIERIVREAGYRSKLLVRSTDAKVDPVGACVGTRGARVHNVIRELHNEKIDIIPFAEDRVMLLQNMFHPLEIRKVGIDNEAGVITVVVDDQDFAAAVGKKGFNVRLNGQLLGMELEVRRMSEYRLALEEEKSQLAELSNDFLDQPLELADVSSLILDFLKDAGYDTLRKVLKASPEELAKVPGMSLEIADKIIDQVKKHLRT